MLFTILSPVVVGKIYHTFDVTLKLWQIWIWMWNICDRPMGPLVPGMSRDNHPEKINLRCPWWGKKRMLKQASVILEKWNCLRLNVKLKVKIGFIHLDTKEGGRFPKSCCSDCKNKKIDRGLHTYFTNSSCRPAYISNIEGQNEAIYANLAYILPLCTTEPYWLG